MPAWSAPGAVAQAPPPAIGSKAVPRLVADADGSDRLRGGAVEADLARRELGPGRCLERLVGVRVVERTGGAARGAAAGLGQRLHALERRRARRP